MSILAGLKPAARLEESHQESFLDLLRSFPGHARRTLGGRGVAWAAGSLVTGLASAVLSMIGIATSLNHGEIENHRYFAADILALDNGSRLLMRSLSATSSSRVAPEPGGLSLPDAWQAFQLSLEKVCGQIARHPTQLAPLAETCARRIRFVDDVSPGLEQVSLERRPLDAAILRELLSVRDTISALGTEVGRETDALVDRMATDYRSALIVLILSTVGFVGAGVVLVLLVGRVSMRHYEQSQRAVEAAELLRETMEALPAGVVVYGADERLMMYNQVAAAITPSLRRSDCIGRTYEDLARESARELEVAGHGPQPVDEWVGRFRNKRELRMRQAIDGRWFDWSERATPSGLTVGLRVDVTEVERARTEYAMLVDSLSDVVFKADLLSGRFLFIGASAQEMLGVPASSMVGMPILDFLAAEDREVSLEAVRAELRSPSRSVRVLQCRMRHADGSYRHIEARFRTAASPTGQPIVVGVIADMEERVELARRLDDKIAELERARHEYQSAVDSISDVAYRLDVKTGRFTFFSAAAEEFFGEPPEKLVGKHFLEIVAPESRERVQRVTTRPYDAGDKGTLAQFTMLAKGGQARHVEVRASRRLDEQGNVISTGVIRDVEQRVQLERQLDQQVTELRIARAEYQSLVDSLSDMVCKIDMESGRIIYANPATAQFFGEPLERIVGSSFIERSEPETRAYIEGGFKHEFRNSGRPAQLRFRMYAANGQMRHVEARYRRMIDEHGKLIMSGVIRDIEERVQLERRLERETARLRSVVESSGALIVLADRRLNVVMVNSGFVAMTGISHGEAIGRPLRDVLNLPPDVRLDQPLQFAVKLEAEGRTRLVALTATPVVNDKGQVNNVVLLGVDDTGRRDAEAALHDVERFATVGEMAATMAHELSQPLQVINIACASASDEIAYPADGANGPDTEYLKARLERIGSQVEAASRIIGDLRAFVRGASTPENVGLFDPARAIESAIGLTGYGVRQAGADLRVHIVESLPQVAGEAGRLEQLLVNLINNARDAGGRTIEIAAEKVVREGKRLVRIVVDDTGRGIPADLLPRLFVSFVTTKAKGKGTGLGLRICRRIVEEMGGTITAGNRPEGGARFEVLLPSAQAASDPAGRQDESRAAVE